MKVFSNTKEALIFISNSNLSNTDKICKTDHILHGGIAKVNKTIIVIDKYGLLD